MNFKLIPFESPPFNFRVRPLNKSRKVKPKSIAIQIRKKVEGKNIHHDDLMIHKCALKLNQFVKKRNSKKNQESIKDLIYHMQRGLLSLQRTEHKILQKRNKKSKH